MTVLVYVTAQNLAEAGRLARAAVEERLAACANILGAVQSIYWWDGEVQESGEAALILKTRSDLAEALAARLKELHSYEVPCIAVFPISGGNSSFLDWIKKETSTSAGKES
jgi:periplasmic divalent cation tolerance protein